MIVTIDSNVAEMPRIMAEQLIPNNNFEWCPNLNRCIDVETPPTTHPSRNKIYYNTPISMSDNIAVYNMRRFEPSMYNFVYIDTTPASKTSCAATLKRIKQNLIKAKLDNVICLAVVTTPQSALEHQKKRTKISARVKTIDYLLVKGHCDNEKIAELVSMIITLHVIKNERLTEYDVLEFIEDMNNQATNKKPTVKPKPPISITAPDTPIIIDLYKMMQVQEKRFPEQNDCTVCKN